MGFSFVGKLISQPTKKLDFDIYTMLEAYLSNLEEENNQIDIDYIVDYLEGLRTAPLNLNKATIDELESLSLLTSDQVNAIVSYRELYGPFISIYELQVIPIMNLESVNRIRSFVSVYGAADQFQKSILDMATEGQSTLYLKWKTVLEDKKAYDTTGGKEPKYLGDKNHYLVRYKYNYNNKLRYGITMEKDAGEEFFSGINKNGFDYYSAYFYVKDYSQYIKSFCVGDYNISLGQGLIINNSFGGRKSSFTTSIKKSGRIFRPYSSVSENNFNRGVALELGLGKDWTLSSFFSRKNRDAGIHIDTLNGEVESYFSSLLQDGNHRTKAETAKKDLLTQTSYGGRLRYQNNKFQVSLNFLQDRFDSPFQRTNSAYTQNRFNGDQLSNISLDYNFRWKNMYFFGESAMSDNKAMAHLHGLLLSPNPKLSLAVLYRDYDKKYQVLNSNSFSETSGTNDENGLYLGIEFRPIKNWTISAYGDFWSHDWAKFKQLYPSKGKEFLLKLRYYRKRKFEAYAQYFYENKKSNFTKENSHFKSLKTKNIQRLRLHFSHKINKEFELRNRIEFSFYEFDKSSTGYLIYQDILYRPLTSPLSITARFAIFDTKGYNSRIYAYENDILYEFYIPAYYGKGTRYYVNLRYRVFKHLSAEFRIARTYLPGSHHISTGNESILGDTKTDIKAQLKISF